LSKSRTETPTVAFLPWVTAFIFCPNIDFCADINAEIKRKTNAIFFIIIELKRSLLKTKRDLQFKIIIAILFQNN
jgi:hypothetical protein